MAKRTRTPRKIGTTAAKAVEKIADSEEPTAITTAIHIPKNTWNLLRAVAFRRAQRSGGRASVSKLIVETVERHRSELETELSIDD